MKMKLTAAAFAAFLLLGASSGGGQALALGGPGGGGGIMCVAMCSAAQYERDMATLQQLYAMLDACGDDDDDQSCREAAGNWANAQFEESRRLWEECNKSCEPGQ